jgi:hypothetical protein
MARRKQPTISDEVLDQLLAGADASAKGETGAIETESSQ